MCIRDSVVAEPFDRGAERAELLLHPFVAAVEVIDPLDLGAVSYTHLRAHETVLELVCRLLLEKKNDLTQLIILRCSCANSTNLIIHVI